MSDYCTRVAGINKYVCLNNGGSESELQQALYKIGPIRLASTLLYGENIL